MTSFLTNSLNQNLQREASVQSSIYPLRIHSCTVVRSRNSELPRHRQTGAQLLSSKLKSKKVAGKDPASILS